MVLQVEEPGSAQDVGEGFRASDLLPLEQLSARERPLELPHELLDVVLHHPVQRHQVAVDVVQHFYGRRLRAQEEQRSAASRVFKLFRLRVSTLSSRPY
jgi:hypothetical protein